MKKSFKFSIFFDFFCNFVELQRKTYHFVLFFMKHIQKNKEPQTLTDLRSVTQKNQIKVTFHTLPTNVIYDLVHTLLYDQADNTLGEILPAGNYRTIPKCKDNYNSLTAVQQSVLSAIDVLNLNAERLKDLRKIIYAQIVANFRKYSKTQLDQLIEHYQKKDKTGTLTRFTELIVYYLKIMYFFDKNFNYILSTKIKC
jgi:hypothetical protein